MGLGEGGGLEFKANRQRKIKSKLQKSSFMYATYYKLCPLSLISTVTVLDVCNTLHAMSFNSSSVSFYG
ncbi:hypothetical protein Hanom_Chr13g01217721 [Helianthus anomalus]